MTSGRHAVEHVCWKVAKEFVAWLLGQLVNFLNLNVSIVVHSLLCYLISSHMTPDMACA